MFKTFDNKEHHLQELAALERMLINQFDAPEFYESLLKFINVNFNVDDPAPPSLVDLRALDNFVNKHLASRLSDMERWIVRGFIIGKALQIAEEAPKKFIIDVTKLPTDISTAASVYDLNPNEVRALQWAKMHGGENMRHVVEGTATVVRKNLLETIQKGAGFGFFKKTMENEIKAPNGDINRMWRRVAITEVNSAYTNGYLLTLADKSWVVGFSLPDACVHCKAKIDGKVFLYTEQGAPINYGTMDRRSTDYRFSVWRWENTVWAGKNNVGRSFSPNRKKDPEGGVEPSNLVRREHDEQGMPAIPMHPHCRCRWLRINVNNMWIDADKKVRLKFEDHNKWEDWYKRVIEPKRRAYEVYTKEALP